MRGLEQQSMDMQQQLVSAVSVGQAYHAEAHRLKEKAVRTKEMVVRRIISQWLYESVSHAFYGWSSLIGGPSHVCVCVCVCVNTYIHMHTYIYHLKPQTAPSYTHTHTHKATAFLRASPGFFFLCKFMHVTASGYRRGPEGMCLLPHVHVCPAKPVLHLLRYIYSFSLARARTHTHTLRSQYTHTHTTISISILSISMLSLSLAGVVARDCG